MKSDPITIRLNDNLVHSLKEEARRLSFEKNQDILYTDLIRSAVQEFATKIDKSVLSNNADGIVIEESSIEAFEHLLSGLSEDELLTMFGFIRNPLSIAVQNNTRSIFEAASLPRAILTQDKYQPGKTYDRNYAGYAYYLSRRGAVPDSVSEGSEFSIPTFQIACSPAVSIDKILSRDIRHFAEVVFKAGIMLAREETANFCGLVGTAAMNRDTIKVDALSLDAVLQGYDLLLKNVAPRHVVMSPSAYISVSREAAGRFGNWRFGNIRTDNQPVGHFQGADIWLTDRAQEAVYFIADNAGYITEKQPLRTLMHPNPSRLRGDIVMWVEIGMAISADYLVSSVQYNTDKEVVTMGRSNDN